MAKSTTGLADEKAKLTYPSTLRVVVNGMELYEPLTKVEATQLEVALRDASKLNLESRLGMTRAQVIAMAFPFEYKGEYPGKTALMKRVASYKLEPVYTALVKEYEATKRSDVARRWALVCAVVEITQREDWDGSEDERTRFEAEFDAGDPNEYGTVANDSALQEGILK